MSFIKPEGNLSFGCGGMLGGSIESMPLNESKHFSAALDKGSIFQGIGKDSMPSLTSSKAVPLSTGAKDSIAYQVKCLYGVNEGDSAGKMGRNRKLTHKALNAELAEARKIQDDRVDVEVRTRFFGFWKTVKVINPAIWDCKNSLTDDKMDVTVRVKVVSGRQKKVEYKSFSYTIAFKKDCTHCQTHILHTKFISKEDRDCIPKKQVSEISCAGNGLRKSLQRKLSTEASYKQKIWKQVDTIRNRKFKSNSQIRLLEDSNNSENPCPLKSFGKELARNALKLVGLNFLGGPVMACLIYNEYCCGSSNGADIENENSVSFTGDSRYVWEGYGEGAGYKQYSY